MSTLNIVHNDVNIYDKLLQKYPEITSADFTKTQTKHGVLHFIPTKGPPVQAKARRLSPEKLAIAKQEFKKIEDMGIIRRSKSLYACCLHMVPKPDGGMRPTGDYQNLNAITIPIVIPCHTYKISLLTLPIRKSSQKWI